jgi:hypothetical protein
VQSRSLLSIITCLAFANRHLIFSIFPVLSLLMRACVRQKLCRKQVGASVNHYLHLLSITLASVNHYLHFLSITRTSINHYLPCLASSFQCGACALSNTHCFISSSLSFLSFSFLCYQTLPPLFLLLFLSMRCVCAIKH